MIFYRSYLDSIEGMLSRYDHMHMYSPDEIYEGITEKLGWEPYRHSQQEKPAATPVVPFVNDLTQLGHRRAIIAAGHELETWDCA